MRWPEYLFPRGLCAVCLFTLLLPGGAAADTPLAGVVKPAVPADPPGLTRPDHVRGGKPGRTGHRPKRGHRHKTGTLIVYTERDHPFDRMRRNAESGVTQPADPVEPEPVPADAPVAEPLDPRSPRSIALARGVDVPSAPFAVGRPLRRGVPQVTLNWRSYGLPEPPIGQIYVRVGRDLLLIEATSRRVVALVPSR